MGETYILIAKAMLSKKDPEKVHLNSNLEDELVEIAVLVDNLNSTLISRQVIATIIVNWKRRNLGVPAYREV